MGGRSISTVNIVALCLGVALAVFFGGVTAAVAAGQTVPSALWAAGSAVSGALVGLLLPAPNAPERHKSAALIAKAHNEATSAATHEQLAASTPNTKTTVKVLIFVFLAMLTLSIVLAAGVVHPHSEFGAEPLKNISKAVLALASASGSALISIYAPTAGKEA